MFDLYRVVTLIALFFGIRFQYNQRLSDGLDPIDNRILLCNHAMMLSVLIGGWIMQITYFPLLGLQSYFTIIVAKCRRRPIRSITVDWVKYFSGFIFAYAILRVYTQKANNYAQGQIINGFVYQGVTKSLDGWNCTYPEFWIVSTILFLKELVAIYIGYSVIEQQKDIEHNWKFYFLLRKSIPTLFCMSVMILFYFYSWMDAESPIQCMNYWVSDGFWKSILIEIIKGLIYVGPGALVVRFYCSITPFFKLQSILSIDPRSTQSTENNQQLIWL